MSPPETGASLADYDTPVRCTEPLEALRVRRWVPRYAPRQQTAGRACTNCGFPCRARHRRRVLDGGAKSGFDLETPARLPHNRSMRGPLGRIFDFRERSGESRGWNPPSEARPPSATFRGPRGGVRQRRLMAEAVKIA